MLPSFEHQGFNETKDSKKNSHDVWLCSAISQSSGLREVLERWRYDAIGARVRQSRTIGRESWF